MVKFKTSQRQLEKMLEEALVDCYGADEQFSGLAATIEDKLPFPFKARVLGEMVEVIGIDNHRTSMNRGIIAWVRKGGKEYPAALSEIQVAKSFNGLKWLELYEFYVDGDAGGDNGHDEADYRVLIN
ncbi:MAG: calcium-binding protein [Anaerolineae bacterium]